MKNTFFLISMFVAMTTSAGVISPQHALSRIENENFKAKKENNVYVRPQLVKTIEVDGSPALYLFNRNDSAGFMVVSARDEVTPIWGYSDTGAFDPNDMPPALEFYLHMLAEEVSFTATNTMAYTPRAQYAAVRANIAPKVTTQWNQKSPFNYFAPYDSNGQQCPTGCVSTALAQIVKYYNYPTCGNGTVSYDWVNTAGSSKTLIYDFTGHEFDYGNMINSYNSSYTSIQRDAVADLMYALGVAVKTNYHSTGSSSNIIKAMNAMVNNFNYDIALHAERKKWYSASEWEEIVYSELQNVGPVYMDATDNLGGHAFVLDGFQNGYFHVNWGWGGKSDGYFLLSSMNPYSSGSTGFIIEQNILSGLQPQRSGSHYDPRLAWAAGVKFVNTGQNMLVRGNLPSNGCGNYSPAVLTDVTLGLELTNSSGITFYAAEATSRSIEAGGAFNYYEVPLSGIDPGEYTVRTVYKLNGEWHRILGDLSQPQTGKINVSGNTSESNIYLIGQPAGGWGANVGTPVAGENGIYRTELNLTATSFFGFAKYLGDSADDWTFLNDVRYGPPSGDCAITSKGSFPIGFSKTTSWSLPAGKWQLAFDANTMKLYVAPEGEEIYIPEIKDNVIYLIGEPAGGWGAKVGKEIEGENGVFNFELNLPSTQYFGFAKCLGADVSDWATLNANRYGSAEADDDNDGAFTIKETGVYNAIIPCERAWCLGAGKYNISFNPSELKLKVEFSTPAVDPDPNPNQGPVVIYWNNSATGWITPHIHYWGAVASEWPGVSMIHVKGDIWKYVCPAGTNGCLFNAGDGEATKTSDFPAIHNHVYTSLGDQGEYSDIDPLPDPEPDFNTVYLIGEPAGGWLPNIGRAIIGSGGVFNIDLNLSTTSYFGFAKALGSDETDWSTLNANRFGAAEVDNDKADTYSILSPGSYPVKFPNTNSWNLPAGNWELSLDIKSMLLNVSERTTGLEDINFEIHSRYLNLQGCPVVNPHGGIYIELRGQKATKIYIP